MARILVVDNYDSFVYNLVQYLGQLGADVEVHRNDRIDVAGVLARRPDGVLLSPGPGHPTAAGICVPLLHAAPDDLPIFGVCLGQQAMGVAWGATVDRAPELMHGKVSLVHHSGQGVLADLPDPFPATRYHSLAVQADTLPADWEVTGWTDSGVVMAMRHRSRRVEGVQFHPESVLTQGGHLMLARWLADCGDGGEGLRRAPALAARMDALRLAAS